MSFPRQVLPGVTYMITRRCTQRQFLMRPDAETNNAFIYCLADAAETFGIDLLFTIANSNHHHTGIHDRLGNFPLFIERFHKLFAKCQNRLRGRSENFWSNEQTSVVCLADKNAVLDKMTYALTNPVKHGMVAKAEEWPGVSAFEAIIHGQPLTAERPRHFFREDGSMPEKRTLKFVQPEAFGDLSAREFAELVRENVQRVEAAAAEDRRLRGVGVLGREAVLRQDWRGFPATAECTGNLNPTVAARNRPSRADALERNRQFRNDYILAREAFLRGDRDVIFPAGTWWLCRFAKVKCVPLEALAA